MDQEQYELRKKKTYRNVIVSLYLSITATLLYALTEGSVSDAYLYFLSGRSNVMVGLEVSITGGVQLICLIPVGFLVDRYDRGFLCKVSATLLMLYGIMFGIAIYYNRILYFFAAMAVKGVAWELAMSASECIFWDSIEQKSRTNWIAKKSICVMLSGAVGAFLVLMFFAFFGNDWNLTSCRIILFFGLILFWPHCIISLCILVDPRYCYSRSHDILYLNHEPNDIDNKLYHIQDAQINGMDNSVQPVINYTENSIFPNKIHTDSSYVYEALPEYSHGYYLLSNQPEHNSSSSSMNLTRANNVDTFQFEQVANYKMLIPYIVSLSDIVRAIGAGMSIKFFNLFLINDFNFEPIQLAEVNIALLLCISIATWFAVDLSKRIGRGTCSVLFQFSGCILIFGLSVSYTPYIFIILYLLRGAAQNGVAAIDRSIIADTTESHNRGKWMAIESFANVLWACSAFFGGYISDKFGYRRAFLLTGIIYCISSGLCIPLICLFPAFLDNRKESHLMEDHTE